jgi:hypothetical protein
MIAMAIKMKEEAHFLSFATICIYLKVEQYNNNKWNRLPENYK